MAAAALITVAAWIAPAAARPARAAPGAPRPNVSAAQSPPVWLAALDGGVFALGSAPFRGSLGGERTPPLMIAFAADSTGKGYWLAGLDGDVRAFGDAGSRGSLRGVRINRPIVGMAATPSGNGYWLVASDGGVFTFGDAHFYGSLGARRLAQPIAALAATPNGRGYWILDRAGRVFPFGNAAWRGDSAAAHALAAAIVPTRSGRGYWIASAAGAVRAFGDAAPVRLPSLALRAPIMGMATPWASSSGLGLTFLDALRSTQRTWAGPHEVALTFDDGPSQYTQAVLSVLARYGVRATFFTLGYLGVTHPELLTAEADAGMSVQVHSWDHPDLTRLPLAAVDDQLTRAADLVQRVTGRRPTCFRPPYGSTNHTIVAEGEKLGLTQVLWNVDPSDYLRPGASVIASRVLAVAHGQGLVIGIHDGGGDRSQTVAALPEIIEGLRARGYTFVPLCG
jgi:peptidoglycan-N-acetylglucosamine deacetylase